MRIPDVQILSRPSMSSASRDGLSVPQEGTGALLRQALQNSRPWVRRMDWAFTYANVRPYNESSPEALLFLSTNIAFVVAGTAFASVGNSPELGLLCDLAATASVGYHYAQCRYGGTQRPIVQLAMLVDYAFALPSMLYGLAYAAQLGDVVPASAIICGAASIAALVAGWLVEGPRAYMFVHGAWHLLAAVAGRELALAHAVSISTPPHMHI